MNPDCSNIILGIDPGTLLMGYGIIHLQGKDLHLVEMGVLKLNSIPDSYERLQKIHEKVMSLIEIHHPQSFAIEAPFYGKNIQSMLKLGRAQGVAIAAAIQAGLKVCEYSPKKIKQVVSGNGNASKEQIWQMLEKTLHFKEKPRYFDATDAVAVAVCHHFQQKLPDYGAANSPKSWTDFVLKHPEKVAGKKSVRSMHTF